MGGGGGGLCSWLGSVCVCVGVHSWLGSVCVGGDQFKPLFLKPLAVLVAELLNPLFLNLPYSIFLVCSPS